MKTINQFIKKAPKAELHVHIEGTLEPDLALKLAQRNNLSLDLSVIKAQKLPFKDLQQFLDLNNYMIKVLITEEDFYDLTHAYLDRAYNDNVKHVEVFFEAQSHLSRGIALEVVIGGITRAFTYGESLGISCHLILSFKRDLPESDAFEILKEALPFKQSIVAVGLASAEKNNPPKKFEGVFQKALSHGFLTVAHAGEEGPADYIWQALELLKVSRIDHGNACTNDQNLIQRLVQDQIPLTMCPLSNLALGIIKTLQDHPAKFLLDQGVCVTINSDDPAYFGGYVNDNLISLAQALNLEIADIYALLKNSFEASFLSSEKKALYITQLEEFTKSYS